MSRIQSFLTNVEREQALERYRKSGATVRREGDRSLVVVKTAWIDEGQFKRRKNYHLR